MQSTNYKMQIDIHPDILTTMFVYSLLSSFDNFKCAIETRNELSTPDTLHIKIVEKNEARKSTHSNSTKAMFANKYKDQKHSNKPTHERKNSTRVNDKK